MTRNRGDTFAVIQAMKTPRHRSENKLNDLVGIHTERTKSEAAFTRHFKGETILYVFHNNGSSAGNEARCFIARQVYVSYILPGFRFFSTRVI